MLRIIAQLSNIDKHRHLHVILPRVAVHRHTAFANGSSSVSTAGGFKHGEKISLPDEISGSPAVKVEKSFSPYITFDETIGSGPATVESQNVLEVCVEQLETVIVPTFTRLLMGP